MVVFNSLEILSSLPGTVFNRLTGAGVMSILAISTEAAEEASDFLLLSPSLVRDKVFSLAEVVM